MLRPIILCVSVFAIGALFYFATSSGHSVRWLSGYLSGAVLASILIGIALDKVLPRREG